MLTKTIKVFYCVELPESPKEESFLVKLEQGMYRIPLTFIHTNASRYCTEEEKHEVQTRTRFFFRNVTRLPITKIEINRVDRSEVWRIYPVSLNGVIIQNRFEIDLIVEEGKATFEKRFHPQSLRNPKKNPPQKKRHLQSI